MIPLTPNLDSQISTQHSRASSTNSSDGMISDEGTRVYEQYKNLAERNRK
jgi:hypothetical protein